MPRMNQMEMLVLTRWDGVRVHPGDVVEVDDTTAARWRKRGIAKDAKSAPAPSIGEDQPETEDVEPIARRTKKKASRKKSDEEENFTEESVFQRIADGLHHCNRVRNPSWQKSGRSCRAQGRFGIEGCSMNESASGLESHRAGSLPSLRPLLSPRSRTWMLFSPKQLSDGWRLWCRSSMTMMTK